MSQFHLWPYRVNILMDCVNTSNLILLPKNWLNDDNHVLNISSFYVDLDICPCFPLDFRVQIMKNSTKRKSSFNQRMRSIGDRNMKPS